MNQKNQNLEEIIEKIIEDKIKSLNEKIENITSEYKKLNLEELINKLKNNDDSNNNSKIKKGSGSEKKN